MQTYRINIAVDVNDQSGPGLAKARGNVTAFEQSANRAHQTIAKLMRPWTMTLRAVDSTASVIRGIQQHLTAFVRAPYRITISAVDGVSSVIDRIVRRGAIARLSSGLGRVASGVLSTLANPAALVSGALAAGASGLALSYPLQLAANAEEAVLSFRDLTHSEAEATAMLRGLQHILLDGTPFKMPELTQASTKLLDLGYNATQVTQMLKPMGDAAAGLFGADAQQGLDKLTSAVTRTIAQGTLHGQGLRELQRMGIPVLEILTKGFQKEGEAIRDTVHMQELITSGAVPARRAMRILLEGLEERFPNAMAHHAQMLTGLWNTIKNTFNIQAMLPFGQGLASAVEPRLRSLVDWFHHNERAVTSFGSAMKGLGASFGTFLMGPAAAATRFVGSLLLDPKFQSADFLGKMAMAGSRALDAILPKLGLYGDYLRWLFRVGLPAMSSAGATAFAWIAGTAVPALQSLSDAVGPYLQLALLWLTTTGIPNLKDAWDSAATFVKTNVLPVLDDLGSWLQDEAPKALDWLINTGWPALQHSISDAADTARGFFDGLLRLNDRLKDNGTYQAFIETWNNIRDAASAVVDLLKGSVHQQLSDTRGDIRTTTDDVELFAESIHGVASGIRELSKLLMPLVNFFKSLHNTNWIPGYSDEVYKSAKQLSDAINGQDPNSAGNRSRGPSSAHQAAIDFALTNIGSHQWMERDVNGTIVDYCEKFVEAAFNTSGVFQDARAAMASLMTMPGGKLSDSVAGQLVFFKPDATNGGHGHVGLSYGDGSFISEYGGRVRITRPGDTDYAYWQGLYAGRGWANYGSAAGPANATRGRWDEAAMAAAVAQGLDPLVFDRQIRLESSNFDPAVLSGQRLSSAGARGIAQFMPGTAAEVEKMLGVTDAQFWADPNLQLAGSAALMHQYMEQFGDLRRALIAYNAGPNATAGSAAYDQGAMYADAILTGKAMGLGGGGTHLVDTDAPSAAPSSVSVTIADGAISISFPNASIAPGDVPKVAEQLREVLAGELSRALDEAIANMTGSAG